MNVNLGRPFGRKHERNLSHDISTTFDFGFCQPLVSRRLHAEDSVNVRVADIVRLQPLVKPLFGSISLKKYFRFVKTADVWHPYESMLSGQTYNGAGEAYIPTKMPCIKQSLLTRILALFSDVYMWKSNDPSTYVSQGNGSLHFGFPVGQTDASCAKYFKDAYCYGDGLDNLAEALASLTDFGLTPGIDTSTYICHRTETYDTSTNFVDPGSCDFYDMVTVDSTKKALFGFKLNRYGRNLRKILIGNGYQMNFSNDEVEIVRLFGYYKAWFDLFMPAREITWKDTAAFKCMEMIEQYNTSIADMMLESDWAAVFAEFLWDLANTYYTQDPDFVSAQITGNRNSIVPTGAIRIQSPTAGDPHNVIVSGDNNQAKLNFETVGSISSNLLDVLKKMTQRVAAASQIGGRIREYMKTFYGAEYVDGHDSIGLGTDISEIQIGDIFSTAETSEGYLGEYCGRGLGENKGKYFKYSTKTDGYLFCIAAMVPDSKYCQGVDLTLLMKDKYSCYDSAFDGLTLLPTPKYGVYGIEEFPSTADYSGGFGNMPIYSSTKIALNKINGDMSLPSTRESYLPFNIDKMLTPATRQVSMISHQLTSFDLHAPKDTQLTAGTIWRFIGKTRWIGNVNRIFVNEGKYDDFVYDSSTFNGNVVALEPVDDNFIVHCYVDMKVWGNPIPLADSWYTDPQTGDTISVENA